MLWDYGPFYERMATVPGFSQEKSADTIGKVAAGVLVGGIAVHAVAANISKRKELLRRVRIGVDNEQKLDS